MKYLRKSRILARWAWCYASNMQNRPACNIICVAIHNKLPAGHILSPTTWRGRGSPRASIIVRISPLIAAQIWSTWYVRFCALSIMQRYYKTNWFIFGVYNKILHELFPEINIIFEPRKVVFFNYWNIYQISKWEDECRYGGTFPQFY